MINLDDSISSVDLDKYVYTIEQSSKNIPVETQNISALLTAKIGSIAILGFGSLILGLCPILVRRKQSGSSLFQNVTSLLMYFGGGVLLATTFLHLLPEVTEQIESLQKQNILFGAQEFPYAECIMCFGFFMMFTIESVVHICMHPMKSEHEAKNINIKTKNYKTCNGNEPVQVIDPNEVHDHHHDHSHDHSQLLRSGSLRNLLIVLALSIHEVFEGLAVGLEQVSTQVWYLCLAVACHKFVIAFCLGLQITSNTVSNISKKLFILNIVYVVIFALCSPIGIAIGMIISMMASAAADTATLTILSVLLQGIATGTLLYIVFFEILKPHDHHCSRIHAVFNLVFLLLGFVLMAVIQFILAE